MPSEDAERAIWAEWRTELTPSRRMLHHHLPRHPIPARAEERPQDRCADNGGRGCREQQLEGVRGGSWRDRR